MISPLIWSYHQIYLISFTISFDKIDNRRGMGKLPKDLILCLKPCWPARNLASVRIAWEKEKKGSSASLAGFFLVQLKVCSGWLPTLKQMFKLFLLLSCQLWPDCKSASKMMIKSFLKTLTLASLHCGSVVVCDKNLLNFDEFVELCC